MIGSQKNRLFLIGYYICLYFKFYLLSCNPPYPIRAYPVYLRVLPTHPPTHPHLPHSPSIPLHWGIKPSQDQGPSLPLMPDKAPSAPSVLPLTPPLGSLCSVWWLAASICICIGQTLAEYLKGQLYQVEPSSLFKETKKFSWAVVVKHKCL